MSVKYCEVPLLNFSVKWAAYELPMVDRFKMITLFNTNIYTCLPDITFKTLIRATR